MASDKQHHACITESCKRTQLRFTGKAGVKKLTDWNIVESPQRNVILTCAAICQPWSGVLMINEKSSLGQGGLSTQITLCKTVVHLHNNIHSFKITIVFFRSSSFFWFSNASCMVFTSCWTVVSVLPIVATLCRQTVETFLLLICLAERNEFEKLCLYLLKLLNSGRKSDQVCSWLQVGLQMVHSRIQQTDLQEPIEKA